MIVSPSTPLTGTSVLLTGIPAGTTQLIVNVIGASETATDGLRLRVGTSAGIVTTNYDNFWQWNLQTQSYQGSVVGFDMIASNMASQNLQYILSLADRVNNMWVAIMQGSARATSSYNWQSGGRVTLPGVLDRVQLSLVGASSFSAGKVNYIAGS